MLRRSEGSGVGGRLAATRADRSGLALRAAPPAARPVGPAAGAEDALKATHAEILTQRTRIGDLLGQIRDLQAEWTEEAIQRITIENTTLKQRLHQLPADNRILDEPLKAARSNLRFQDRRVAGLEARLTECVGAINPTKPHDAQYHGGI